MQTFLTSSDFGKTAKILDNKRLGKQRVEALTILRTLAGRTTGWRNHPAVRMWQNHDQALVQYGVAMCLEWMRRGFKDTCCEKISSFRREGEFFSYPEFTRSRKFHLAHKSNLIRKNPKHYKPIWPNIPDNLPYIWPVKNQQKIK